MRDAPTPAQQFVDSRGQSDDARLSPDVERALATSPAPLYWVGQETFARPVLQGALADDFAGSAREQRDEVELLAAQVERFTVEPGLTRAWIDAQTANCQRLRRLRAG